MAATIGNIRACSWIKRTLLLSHFPQWTLCKLRNSYALIKTISLRIPPSLASFYPSVMSPLSRRTFGFSPIPVASYSASHPSKCILSFVSRSFVQSSLSLRFSFFARLSSCTHLCCLGFSLSFVLLSGMPLFPNSM